MIKSIFKKLTDKKKPKKENDELEEIIKFNNKIISIDKKENKYKYKTKKNIENKD